MQAGFSCARCLRAVRVLFRGPAAARAGLAIAGLGAWLALAETARAEVRFFVSPDGRLHDAAQDLDKAFQQALMRPFTEFDLHDYGAEHVLDSTPPALSTGVIAVRPRPVDAKGMPVADPALNGGKLIETYANLPDIPGIIGGGASGGAALLNRVFTGNRAVCGAGVEFVFSEPVEGFGTWILDDIVAPSRFVLKVTETGGATHISPPLESGNGTRLAVEGFLGAVSTAGMVKVVVEQQTTPGGTPTDADFFYLDHFQVGARQPPEVCDDGVDNNDDGAVDCADTECDRDPACLENCTDGVDNDSNGLIDCADPDCQNSPRYPQCPETLCADGQDNNANGLGDCADPDCFGKPGCTVETVCGDGQDNDLDGKTDCDDPDCTDDVACPENCTDGIDNDSDGWIDCQDLECMPSTDCPAICESIDPAAEAFRCVDSGCSGLPACEPGPLFFIHPDGRLTSPPADWRGDRLFQDRLGLPVVELDFPENSNPYLSGPLPAGPARMFVKLLDVHGRPAVEPSANGDRLIELYALVPHVPGIIEGDPAGGAALINRTAAPGAGHVVAAAVEFTFSRAVAGFGAWIVEDLGEPNQFVLKVTEAGGKVSASDPLESGNGTALAVEGFLGAVSNTGIIRAVIEQQTLAGVASDASFFYLDHVQIGPAPPCLDPFADLDGDGDVDQDDFGFFQACLTDSPGGAELRCGCADRDHDGSVDRADLMAFLACKDGAGLPATVECDD